MTQNDTLKKKPSKFLFDMHDFGDVEPIEKPEEIEPPPPVFSEKELETARKESYQSGKNDGLAEAANSREKFVSGLLETISKDFDALYKQEAARARIYEQEANEAKRRGHHGEAIKKFNLAYRDALELVNLGEDYMEKARELKDKEEECRRKDV